MIDILENKAKEPILNELVEEKGKKIGVLLLNHGSQSANWCKMLLDLEADTKNSILSGRIISEVKSAFIEFSEPSISTRLKEFDDEGFTDIIIIPIMMTISRYQKVDIPAIAGLRKSTNGNGYYSENKNSYNVKANVFISPLLDYPDILAKNVVRRAKLLSKNPTAEGLTLVAYGDKDYESDWIELLEKIGVEAKSQLEIDAFTFSWCGHIVGFDPAPTAKAINEILAKKEKAILIPLLVAVDEFFQGRIIGSAIASSIRPEDVVYKPDAVLPEPLVNEWIIRAAMESAVEIVKILT